MFNNTTRRLQEKFAFARKAKTRIPSNLLATRLDPKPDKLMVDESQDCMNQPIEITPPSRLLVASERTRGRMPVTIDILKYLACDSLLPCQARAAYGTYIYQQ